jgi:hypothetical protein
MHSPSSTRPRDRLLAALAGAAMASVLAAAGCGRAPAAAGAPVPASVIGRLTAIAHRAATINGDPAPAWITAVMTTHAKALTSATPGDYVPGSAHVKVFLITMRGHFTAGEASVPPGAKRRPAGTCPWSSTPRPSRALTSASAPTRRQFHPPASDRSPISPATGTDQAVRLRRCVTAPDTPHTARPPLGA